MKPMKLVWRALLYVVLGLFTVFSVFPFVFSVVTSFKPERQAFSTGLPNPPTLANYTEVVRSTPLFLTWVTNSILIALVSVALLVLIAMMGGYALARIEFPGRRLLFVILLASMMVPDQVLWIPNYTTCSRL